MPAHRTEATPDVIDWMAGNGIRFANVMHTPQCDHVSAGDACIGGCEVVQEKLYIVCRQCGEAFDTIETAAGHEPGMCGSAQGFDILPESEAM